VRKVPVFSELRIENTNLCGFKCFICPHQSLTREKGIMPYRDLELVMQRVGTFNGRVDLHGFGEPMLDSSLAEKIAIVSSVWPDATVRIFSTLGVNVEPLFLENLLAAGLDHFELSLYGWDRKSYLTIHGVDCFDLALKNLKLLCEIKAKHNFKTRIVLRKFPLHPRIKPGYTDQDKENICFFYDAATQMGVTLAPDRSLHNYGNGRAYTAPGERTCSIVWGYRRRILQITWDLQVISCCFDFDGSNRWGNLRTHSLEEIFSHQAYRSFIDAHINNKLEKYPACLYCDRCEKDDDGNELE